VPIKSRGVLDRTVRLLVSDWGWPGAVLVLGGVLCFLLIPSTQWLDYRGVPDDMERFSALGVAVVGLVWILGAAAYARVHERDRRGSRRRRSRT
jgi:4-amino-4-deoxy-L-arabinose transferase-like glycosyltransferase